MPTIVELLRSPTQNDRKQAIILLSRNPNKDGIAIVRQLAENDPDGDVRFLAKRALNLVQVSTEPGLPKETLTSDNEKKLKTYLEGSEKEKLSAIDYAVKKSFKTLLPMLIECLAKEPAPIVISALVMAVGKLGTASNLQQILPLLEHENSRVRGSAVEALSLLKTPQAYSHILKLLEDPDNRVRGNAIIAIKALGFQNTIKVIKAMADSPMVSMKSTAAFVLRFFAEESNVQILVDLLASPELNVRNGALKTLEIFKDKGIKKAADILAELGPDAQLKKDSLEVLEKEIRTSSPVITDDKAVTTVIPTGLAIPLTSAVTEVAESKMPATQPPSQQPTSITAEVEEHLPEDFIGSSGKGGLSDHLKSYAQQNPSEPTPDCTLDQILVWARTVQASDIHISPGKPVLYRQFGLLKAVISPVFTVEQTKTLIEKSGIDPSKIEWFYNHGDLETVIVISGAGRFRVTLMKHLAGYNISVRVIPWIIRSFEDSGMPMSCKGLTNWAQGLVLITGPVGSGKTSTLATFVEMINRTRQDHIITIEKPIEFVFEPVKCQISQREVGCHTFSQGNALKGALREDPDILVVSELRDLESIQLAISAAETGHLVFGTMNTINAARTISRITDSFAPEEQAMLQNMLSESLRGIICQQLIPRKDGNGVVPAYEVLIVTTAVSNMIRKEGVHQLASVMTMGKSAGMVTMDKSLMDLMTSGVISAEQAHSRADVKRDFEKFLQRKA
ncbi:MAG: PilT/PilU family type 4a pilus ATPase [Candidatus Riflebacteria bacterium]|nr:PilT/PilU family type 4a pilus ATPase [Candidatus Riflebacteria bacterium]